MKKLLKLLLITVPIVIVVLIVVLYYGFNSIVRTAVQTAGPKVTKTAVTLGGVNVSLLSGKGELTDLVVGNPEGFKTPYAFRLHNIRVDLDVRSLTGDTIVIDEIRIDGPEITYEKSLTGSNITKIQENVDAGKPKEGAPKPEAEKKPGKKIIIKKLDIVNGKINLSVTGAQGLAAPVPLPDIHLTDLGQKEGGASLGEIMPKVVDPLTDAIGQAAQAGLKLLQDTGKAVTEGAGKAVEEGGKTIKEGGKAVKEGAEGVIKGAKDLFK